MSDVTTTPFKGLDLDDEVGFRAGCRRELLALRHWRLALDNYTLEGAGVDPGGQRWTYAVDLERCLSSAAVLDWIAQVSHKVWCSSEALGELVRALNLVLDLQGTLCGWGMNGDRGGKLTRAEVRERCRVIGGAQ